MRALHVTAAAAAVAIVAAGGLYAAALPGPPADPTAVAAAPTAAATTGAASPVAVSPVTAPPVAVPPSSPAGVTGTGPAAAVQATGVPASAPPAAPESPSVPAPAAKRPEAPPAVEARGIGPALDSRINGIIAANSAYALGVSLIDVSDGVVHSYGVKGNFVAASTAKILAASAYYHLVETGRASLSAPMGRSTAGVQIRQMVQQSNNDSWALILGAVGQRGITDYAASIGITYDRTVNLLTTAEMGRTLQLLYTGQLLNGPHTAQLLSYMQNTNYETLIPPAVPPGIGVYHKYGLLFGNLHDASILVKDGRAFVFVVYTRGKSYADMAPRTWIIQELTRTVTAALF